MLTGKRDRGRRPKCTERPSSAYTCWPRTVWTIPSRPKFREAAEICFDDLGIDPPQQGGG